MARVLQYISLRGLWKTSLWNEGVPSYLDHFGTNYIILNFFCKFQKIIFSKSQNIWNKNIEYLGISYSLK